MVVDGMDDHTSKAAGAKVMDKKKNKAECTSGTFE